MNLESLTQNRPVLSRGQHSRLGPRQETAGAQVLAPAGAQGLRSRGRGGPGGPPRVNEVTGPVTAVRTESWRGSLRKGLQNTDRARRLQESVWKLSLF